MSHEMINLIPLIVFFIIFVCNSLYCIFNDSGYTFYHISPVIMLIPSIVLGIILSGKNAIDEFITGMANKQIIFMIIIFLLSGAFANVSKAIGSIDAIVNLIFLITSAKFIIPSIFITAALLGVAIGSSMGVIVAVTPIAIEIATQTHSSPSICVATVISGAMFGDNLSLISDTTIASVQSQSASLIKKFKLNAIFSTISAILTILILMLFNVSGEITHTNYSTITTIPYFIIIVLAILKFHIFIVLLAGILFAGAIGLAVVSTYNFSTYTQDIYIGFLSVNEIMLFSLLMGGAIYLTKEKGLFFITNRLHQMNLSKRAARFIIASLASITDIIIANNTVAILFIGDVAKTIARKNKIKPHDSAFLLDTFSCVFQGIIPHGAQIILASSLSGINPFTISSQVFFCYIMAVVTIIHMTFNKER